VVQLRVDVEAANARRAFDQAARAVDGLGDQLTQAEIDAVRLEDAMDDTAREAARLRAEVNRLGSSAPQQLRDDLLAAERAAVVARIAFERADDSVEQLERSLAEARREAARLEREMNDLDRSAGRGFRNIQRGFLRAGQNSGGVFAAGLANAPVAAAGAALAAALGAAVNGALLAAIGGGVLAGGVALAIKQSDTLQSSFSTTFREMTDDLNRFVSVFDGPLLRASEGFRQTWRDIDGGVGNVFASLAKHIEPLAAGLGELVENAMPGFNRAIEASGPVLEELASALPRIGDALDSFFDSMADGGDGAVKGFIIIVALLAAGITAAGNTLEFLSKALDVGTDAAERYSQVMSKMLGWIPGIGDAWEYAAETLGAFNDQAENTTDIMPIAGVTSEKTAGSIDAVAVAARKAGEAAVALATKLHGLISDTLSADQAALQWEMAIDAVTAAIQENGRNIDTNTAKGQANVQQILAAVAAAEAKYAADLKLAGGEKASAEAVAAANSAYSAQIERLAATLRQAGLTEAQINALLGKYRELANAPDISKRISVYHTTYFREVGGPNYNRTPGGQVAYASGTSYARAGIALVGEEGPEMVRFRGGEQVSTAAETARMLAGSGAWSGGSGYGNTPGPTRILVAPGPAAAGNPMVDVVLSLFRGGQLRMTVDRSNRVVPA
jgi:hypothetical protein